MPAIRTPTSKIAPAASLNSRYSGRSTMAMSSEDRVDFKTSTKALNIPPFPRTAAERAAFRTDSGKTVTAHQWAVYDLILRIPPGKVSTYRDVCAKLGQGSPRSVGSALRKNPFAPDVPCHRVIASNHFIGGFFGEWGRDSKTGIQCDRKINLLSKEGVPFNKQGYLQDPTSHLW